MLTTMFYYDYYKPYLVKDVGGAARSNIKRPKAPARSRTEMPKDAAYLLNKSLKSDVINYAKNVSQSVIGAKDASKYVVRGMEDFNQNAHRHGADDAKYWLSEDLSAFTDAYNKTASFLSSQTHSEALKKLSDNMRLNMSYNAEALKALGISLAEDGTASFDKNVVASSDHGAVNVAIGGTINLFQSIYDDASNALQAPLSDHMQFKSLSYYYNYKFGSMQSNTFKIIESGMLVNRAV